MAASPDMTNDPRFNQIFEYKDGTHPFKISYADYGYRNEAHPEEEHVLLFFCPLMGSRFLHIAKDDVAKKHKVRIINPDRPGFGGSDAIDTKQRMSLWLEVIPALLRHLKIPHVSLASHSGGTVYALDMLLHHPEILDPARPYLAIGAPWILPSHTGSVSLSMAQYLPVAMINHTDKLAKFVNNHIAPLIGASVGTSMAFVAKLVPSSSDTKDDGANADEAANLEDMLWPRIMERLYAEDVQGLSSDAALFLHKVDDAAGWGTWGDYDTLAPRLAEALRAAGRRLTVDVFYAETDFMIGAGEGSKGPLWFNQCWDQQQTADVIEYRKSTVKGADHDRIWSLRCGAMKKVFETMGQRQPDGVSQTPSPTLNPISNG